MGWRMRKKARKKGNHYENCVRIATDLVCFRFLRWMMNIKYGNRRTCNHVGWDFMVLHFRTHLHSHFSSSSFLSLSLVFSSRSIFPVCLFGFNKTSLLFRSQSDGSHLQVDILCRTECAGRWEHISKIIIITIKFQVLGNYKMRRICWWSGLRCSLLLPMCAFAQEMEVK